MDVTLPEFTRYKFKIGDCPTGLMLPRLERELVSHSGSWYLGLVSLLCSLHLVSLEIREPGADVRKSKSKCEMSFWVKITPWGKCRDCFLNASECEFFS